MRTKFRQEYIQMEMQKGREAAFNHVKSLYLDWKSTQNAEEERKSDDNEPIHCDNNEPILETKCRSGEDPLV